MCWTFGNVLSRQHEIGNYCSVLRAGGSGDDIGHGVAAYPPAGIRVADRKDVRAGLPDTRCIERVIAYLPIHRTEDIAARPGDGVARAVASAPQGDGAVGRTQHGGLGGRDSLSRGGFSALIQNSCRGCDRTGALCPHDRIRPRCADRNGRGTSAGRPTVTRGTRSGERDRLALGDGETGRRSRDADRRAGRGQYAVGATERNGHKPPIAIND